MKGAGIVSVSQIYRQRDIGRFLGENEVFVFNSGNKDNAGAWWAGNDIYVAASLTGPKRFAAIENALLQHMDGCGS